METHSSTLAGKLQGRRSLLGYSLRECKESDTAEQLHFTHTRGFPGGSAVKNLSAVKEIQVRSQGKEDSLE